MKHHISNQWHQYWFCKTSEVTIQTPWIHNYNWTTQLWTTQYTKSMKHSPSWKGNSSSDSRNSLHFMKPKGSLPHSTRTRQLSPARLIQSTSSKPQWLNLQLTLYYAGSNHSSDNVVAIPVTGLLYNMTNISPLHQTHSPNSLLLWLKFSCSRIISINAITAGLLLHNFTLTQLENLCHFWNLHGNVRFNMTWRT